MSAVLLTISDAAHIYGVPRSTIRRWLSEGRMVRHHGLRDRSNLVDASEVEQLVATHRKPPLAKTEM